MIRRFFIPIVEGHGEQKALPLLIRRIFMEISPQILPEINSPIRVKSGSFLNDPHYFKKYVSYAADKASHAGGQVLIFLDCEDDCPATLGPKLLAKAKTVRSDVPTTVVLAHREYETWFLAAAESLRGCAGLPADLSPPADPERIPFAYSKIGCRVVSLEIERIRSAVMRNLQQTRLPQFESFEFAYSTPPSVRKGIAA